MLQSKRRVLCMIVLCRSVWSCRDMILLEVRQGRAGQGRAGQGRAGQGRTGQARAEYKSALHTSGSDFVRHHPVMPSAHINIQEGAVTAQLYSEACLDASLVVLVELVPATARP